MDSSRIIGVKQTKSHIGIISSNDENVNESIGRLLFFQEGQKREGVGVLISSKHIITPISNIVSLQTKSLSQKDSFVFQTSRGEYIGITELFLEKAFLYDDWTEAQIADQQNCGCAVLQLEKSIDNLRPVGLLSVFDFTTYFSSQPIASNQAIFMASGNNKSIITIEQQNCSQQKHGLQMFPPQNSVAFRTPEQTPVFVKEATNLDGYCLIGFANPSIVSDSTSSKSYDLITLSKDNFDMIHRWLNGNNSSFTVEMENTLDNSGRCLKSKELKDVKCEHAHSAKIVSLFKLEKFYVASCSEDKQIKVWNYRTGKLKKIFKTDRACKLVFGIDHYLIGVEGFMLIVIDWKNKRVESISNHSSEIVCVNEVKIPNNPTTRYILVLDAENTLSLYRFESATFTKESDLFRWEPLSDSLNTCLVYSESSVLLASSATGTVIIFNWRTCSIKLSFACSGNGVRSASGSSSIGGGQHEGKQGILCATLNPCNRMQVFIGKANGMLELFDCEKGTLISRVARFEEGAPVLALDKQSASTIVLTDGKDYCLINCNANSNYHMQRLNSNHSSTVCLVKNLDEEFYLTADVAGRLRIWQLELPRCNGISFPFKPIRQFNVLDCPELREDQNNNNNNNNNAYYNNNDDDEQEKLCQTSSFTRENKGQQENRNHDMYSQQQKHVFDKDQMSPIEQNEDHFDQTFSNSKFGEQINQSEFQQQQQQLSPSKVHSQVQVIAHLQQQQQSQSGGDSLQSPQFTPSNASASASSSAVAAGVLLSSSSQQVQANLTPQKLKIKQIITPLNLNEVFRVQRSQLEASGQKVQQNHFGNNHSGLTNSFGHSQNNPNQMGGGDDGVAVNVNAHAGGHGGNDDDDNDSCIESEFSLVEKQVNQQNYRQDGSGYVLNAAGGREVNHNNNNNNVMQELDANNFSSFRQDVKSQNNQRVIDELKVVKEQNSQLSAELERLKGEFDNLRGEYRVVEKMHAQEVEKNKKEKESNVEILAQLDKSAHVMNKHSEIIGLLNGELTMNKVKISELSAEVIRVKEMNVTLESELRASKELSVAITNELDKQTSQSLRDHETILQLKREIASFMMLKDQLTALKQMQLQLAQQTTEWNERESNGNHNTNNTQGITTTSTHGNSSNNQNSDLNNQQNQVKILQQEQIEDMRKENARVQKVSAQIEAVNSNLMLEQTTLKKEGDRVKAELRRTKESLEHWVRQYNVLLQREEILTKNLESKEDLINLLRYEIGKITGANTITSTTTHGNEQNLFDQNASNNNNNNMNNKQQGTGTGHDEWNSILSLINNDASFAHLSRIEFMPTITTSPKINPPIGVTQTSASPKPEVPQNASGAGTFSRQLLPPTSHIRQLSNQQQQQQLLNQQVNSALGISKESLNLQSEPNVRERRSKSPQQQNINYSSSHKSLASQAAAAADRSQTPTNMDDNILQNIQRNSSLTNFISNSTGLQNNGLGGIERKSMNAQLPTTTTTSSSTSATKYSSKFDYNSAAQNNQLAQTTNTTKASSMEYNYNSMSPCNRITPSIAPTVAFLTPTSLQKKQKIEEQLKLHYQSRLNPSANHHSEMQNSNNRSSMQQLFAQNINNVNNNRTKEEQTMSEANNYLGIRGSSQKQLGGQLISLSPNVKGTAANNNNNNSSSTNYGKQIDLTPSRMSQQTTSQQLNVSQLSFLSSQQQQPVNQNQWGSVQQSTNNFSKDLRQADYYSRSPQQYMGESKSPSSKSLYTNNNQMTPVATKAQLILKGGQVVQTSGIPSVVNHSKHASHPNPVQLSEHQQQKGNIQFEYASNSQHSQSNFSNVNSYSNPQKSQQSLDFSPVVNLRSQQFDHSLSPNISSNASKVVKRPFH